MREEIEKAYEEKLSVRLRAGLISEKGLAFSLLNTKENVSLDWDYRTWWIGDIIAWVITQTYDFFTEEEKLDWRMNQKNLKQMENYFIELREKYPEEYKEHVPNIMFHCSEVKERTGRNRLTNNQIFNLVRKFVGGTVVRTGGLYISKKDRDKWAEPGTIDPTNICRVEYIKTGRFSHRTKDPEYFFKVIFDQANSLDFWICVRFGLFDHRPKSYYHLRGGTQLIVRAYGWTPNPSFPSLTELVRIAGVKSKNITDQRKIIESYLKEAKSAGYIKHWKPNPIRKGLGGKLDITYKILKVKEWPMK